MIGNQTTVTIAVSHTGAVNSDAKKAPNESIESQVDQTAKKQLCEFCSTVATQACTQCKAVVYCDRKCQLKDWSGLHKDICKKICAAVQNAGNIGKRDEYGLTIPHYLVLFGKEGQIPKNLIDEQMESLDAFNSTPSDLLRLITPPAQGEISLHFQTSTGAIQRLTQANFLRMTGVQFKDGLYAQRRTLFLIRSIPVKHVGTILPDADIVKRFVRSPPKIFLAEEVGMGFGLVAGEDIQEGDIICLSGGEMVETHSHSFRNRTTRVCDGFEHDKVTAPGTLINDGPPNCEFVGIADFQGVAYCSAVRALRKIKKGEFFHISYGMRHSIHGGRYVVGQDSYQEIVNFVRTIPADIDSFVRVPANRALLLYIFSVPSLFFLLHLRGVLKSKDTGKMMRQPSFKKLFEKEQPLFWDHYNKLLDTADWLRKANDPLLTASAERLAANVTEETFIKMIMLICENEKNRPVDFMTQCEALGKVYDHLYQYVHCTQIGTYVGTTDAPATIPQIKFDEQLITDTFSKISGNLQDALITQLEVYLKSCTKNNLQRPELFSLFTGLRWMMEKRKKT